MASVARRRTVGTVEFTETASRQPAAPYRERAAHLSVMATSYEALAENVEISRHG